MGRVILKALLVIALVGAGWIAGRAQSAGPDFEIRVNAPEGETTVECVRGCQLAWVERMDPATVVPNQTFFTYKCGGSGGQRCNSGRVGGWIKR